ncbi:site-specific recombinase XerD [Winogradskyella wandonensis]|uniref:Site-specific recombinase XerD n=1 Tax=Winogradskyella wandonensis TaxID=1442586 RepID=A0A4R1KJB5_9FLAO|nr:site-specific integrase [Winogradskyella wandonensis]TCK64898.1 site-specific recombinase XerD [Winogradskyella wandonensis]
MQTIYDLITLEVQNEHDLEHKPEHKSLFSEPKIYDAKGDLTKRWYVYFTFVNPKTGKKERCKNIYGKTNRYKTKSERYYILNIYKKRLSKLLHEGFNPYADNQELYEKRKANQQATKKRNNFVANKTSSSLSNIDNTLEHLKKEKTISEAFDFALSIKKNVVGASTLSDYKSRCNKLIEYLDTNYPDINTINQLEKKHVIAFLNSVLQSTSARNRNNYRTCLGSIFQSLEDNELISVNFIKRIKPLQATPQKNKTYSAKEQEMIFNYLEKNDKVLLLFIKFISYNLLRPIEVCRLKVKDLNLEQNIVQFQAKNKAFKTKIIPEILLSELPDLSKLDPNALLFTPNGFGKQWDTTEVNRRGYFTNRFKKVIKDEFGFNDNYGLYSFRHTFITKLYRALAKDSSPYAAKSKLMLITGHATMSALEKYLRDIDAELPQDYSELL